MTESKLTLLTTPWDLGGQGKYRDDLTIEQDGARAAVLFFLTVMAKEVSSGKLVPLTDVTPALVPGSLACGAIGGTAAEFAAAGSSSFKIGFDGEAVIEVVTELSGLDSVADTPGYMTCGAIGGTLEEFASITETIYNELQQEAKEKMKPPFRVKVWNGDQSEYLGEGNYEGDVKVYFVRSPDGSLNSLTNAEEKPDMAQLQYFAIS